MPPTKLSLCVFCGSRSGQSARFGAAARALGELIARRDWRLVYGAGDVGIMGEVARAAQGAGADVFGVIPTHLMQAEAGKRDLGRLVVTETMHERKKIMFTNSDVIVVLPGGAGTLDEFFEVLTWRQIGLHARPIYLMDIDGFWQPLVALVDHVIAQGFADPSLRSFFTTVQTVEELEAALGA
jgi:uncharacterized protein (TIGR00730 family)